MCTTRSFVALAVALLLIAGSAGPFQLPGDAPAIAHAAAATPNVAVGPQYGSTHVYVAPEDFDRFVASFLATFGGTASKQGVFTVTPTPSSTMSQLVLTPAGTLSVFGYKTPVPYPFGAERTGYLVTDMDAAIRAARATGADVLVTPFNDPIGRDAIIQWPGGVNTQLYWHTTPPSYGALQSIPENRVYVSADRVAAFIESFLAFAHGKVVSDDAHAPGIEIGRPSDTYRRIRIQSNFGKLTVLVTDGHLPYPYGREITGYEVPDLADTIVKAKASGVAILVAPYSADQRDAAVVQFPGGYIAEIHTLLRKQSASRSTVSGSEGR
jgi:predicted enzyme related to lactoylglutathione lyase